jgi:hypothetical protein
MSGRPLGCTPPLRCVRSEAAAWCGASLGGKLRQVLGYDVLCTAISYLLNSELAHESPHANPGVTP